MRACVFIGPTLPVEQAMVELNAVFLPPVAQGDVLRAARYEPQAIGIIDGYFDQVASVWHKEILWAMAQGIHVYGSASMGALRAAELAPFGMEGVGVVFKQFLDGTLEDDDEVAVLHTTADFGYRSMSEAMVNIRSTFARAEREGVAGAATLNHLLAIAKASPYRDRSYSMVLSIGAEQGLPSDELDNLTAWLPHRAVNQKRDDAIEMLRLMRERLSNSTPPKQVTYAMENTDFWYQVMRTQTDPMVQIPNGQEAIQKALLSTDRVSPGNAVLEEARLKGALYLQARDQGLLRDLALSEAEHLGHGAGEEAIRAQTNRLREQRGIANDDELDRWLEDNHLTHRRFWTLAKAEASLEKLRWARGCGQHLLNQLRLTARYKGLFDRSVDKDRRLKAAGFQSATLESSGLTMEVLMQWYFDRLGPFYPADPRRHASTFDFEGVDALVQAVLREYLYVRLLDQEAET